MDLLGPAARTMWIGTFHVWPIDCCVCIGQEAGLPQHFQILDSDDQLRLIRRSIQALGLDDKRWPDKQAQWYINGKKDEGLLPQHLAIRGMQRPAALSVFIKPMKKPVSVSGLV